MVESEVTRMIKNRKITNKVYKIILRFPKLMLLCNIVLWFIIGMLLSYLFFIIPLFGQIEFFNESLSLASLMAISFGFMGGIFLLMKIDPDKDIHVK